MKNYTTLEEDQNEILTGDERYPLLGDLITEEQIAEVLQSFKGLNKYWNCIEKAQRARKILGCGTIFVGAFDIFSPDFHSSFGYDFIPPYQLHAWIYLVFDKAIFDPALPGVIEKGLNTSDHIGPMLTDRSPFILAGIPPNYMKYQAVQPYPNE